MCGHICGSDLYEHVCACVVCVGMCAVFLRMCGYAGICVVVWFVCVCGLCVCVVCVGKCTNRCLYVEFGVCVSAHILVRVFFFIRMCEQTCE